MANIPIVTDVTKAELDALVAANGLEEGLQYRVTDENRLVLSRSSSSYILIEGFEYPDIKVGSGTIPALTPGERSIVTVNLGGLNNKKRCCIRFVKSTVTDTEITKGSIYPNNSLKVVNSTTSGINPKIQTNNYMFSDSNSWYLMLVSEDYNKCARFGINQQSATAEKYDADSILPIGFTYESIGVGVISGWYAFNNSGAMELDKKIQIESMWLSQSEGNTVLNIALKNTDSSANSPKDFKVAVYD